MNVNKCKNLMITHEYNINEYCKTQFWCQIKFYTESNKWDIQWIFELFSSPELFVSLRSLSVCLFLNIWHWTKKQNIHIAVMNFLSFTVRSMR